VTRGAATAENGGRGQQGREEAERGMKAPTHVGGRTATDSSLNERVCVSEGDPE
jgi:hypothetical protein